MSDTPGKVTASGKLVHVILVMCMINAYWTPGRTGSTWKKAFMYSLTLKTQRLSMLSRETRASVLVAVLYSSSTVGYFQMCTFLLGPLSS